MLHQNLKEVYYFVLYPLSKVLRPIYRAHYALARGKKDKVHIGCGPHYIKGFVNIDSNFQRKVDYLLDVRCGLPFPDNSMEFIFSSHMMEHLYINEAIELLRDCHRVLKSDGYMRLTLPDFEFAFRILAGDENSEFPRRFVSRQGQAVNFMFCDGQHKYGYTKEIIKELALELGFSSVAPAPDDEQNIPNVHELDPGGSFSVYLFKART